MGKKNFFRKIVRVVVGTPSKQVLRLISNNPDLARAAGAVIGASLGGGSTTTRIGESLGTAIAATAQHREAKQIIANGERKIEAAEAQEHSSLTAQTTEIERQLSAERARIKTCIVEVTKEREKAMHAIKEEETKLTETEALMNQILDHIGNHELLEAGKKIKQLAPEFYEALSVVIIGIPDSAVKVWFEQLKGERISSAISSSSSSSSSSPPDSSVSGMSLKL